MLYGVDGTVYSQTLPNAAAAIKWCSAGSRKHRASFRPLATKVKLLSFFEASN